MADTARVSVRRELDGIGQIMESASYLVDDRPPGGGGELVTHTTLDRRPEAQERMHADEANRASGLGKETRDQTRWPTGMMVGAISVVAALSRMTESSTGRHSCQQHHRTLTLSGTRRSHHRGLMTP
jgi:hypothetical protein